MGGITFPNQPANASALEGVEEVKSANSGEDESKDQISQIDNLNNENILEQEELLIEDKNESIVEGKKDDLDESNESVAFDEELVYEEMPSCILHPGSKWKTIWNLMMMLIIVEIALVVPYRIPFEDVTPPGWFYIDVITDFLFIIDVFLNFITAIENDNGEICTDRVKIIVSYMRSWFLIDLSSSIPITLI